MKTNRLALTVAVSALVAAAASAATDTKNWFTNDVSATYTDPVAAPWSVESGADNASSISNGFLVVDVDGTLNWTAPSATEAARTKTILTIPTKFVSATELPEINSLGDAQAAVVVFEDSNGVNHYYGYSSGVNNWVALSGTPDLTQIVNLKLVFNYDLQTPTVQFYVGATELTAAGTSFTIANDKTAVAGVGFSGTGVVGDFTGDYEYAVVAQVGATKYKTFADAVSNGGTQANPITLLDDVAYTFTAGQTLYINEGGFTFTATPEASGYEIQTTAGTPTLYSCVASVVIPVATNDGSGEQSGGSTVNYNATTEKLTTDFNSAMENKDLAFIRVWNGTKFVTKRIVNAGDQTNIDTSALDGTPTKVVAYYGDVSAIPTGMDRPTASGIVVNANNATVTVPGLKSGLYYKIVSGGSKVGEAQLIDPANDGESTTFTVSKPATGWGAVTFKVVASDDAN